MSRVATLLVLLAALLVAAPAAYADAFVVANGADLADPSIDGDCDPDDDGSEADCTLRAALEEANATAATDTITFADGITNVDVSLAGLVAGTGCLVACPVAIDGGGDVVVRWSGATGPALTFAPGSAGSSLTALRIERSGAGAGALVRIEGSNVALAALTLAGAATSGAEIAGTAQNASLSSVVVSGSGGDGIAISDSAADVTISSSTVSGGGADGIGIGGSADGVTIADSAVTGNARDGIQAGSGARDVTVTRTTVSGNGGDGVTILGQRIVVTRSPVFGNAIAPIALGGGANGGIAPPADLRVGPRRTDGTLPITGSTPSGTVEIYRGDPHSSAPIAFLDQVSGGTFSYVPSPEPAPGTVFAATFRDANGTSRFATTAVPDDVVSPAVTRAVAISTNEVRVLLSEAIDPATAEPGDFALEMAGSARSVDAVRVEGASVVLSSAAAWGHGEAGFVAVNGPGGLVDAVGNPNLSRAELRVLAAPGDFAAPVASRLSIRPRRICLTAGRRCRRTGASVVFLANEAGRAELVILRGNRRVGVDRTPPTVAGRNVIRFTGRINGRKLRPGPYRMLLYLEDEVGNRTVEPPIRRFTVVRTAPPRRR